MILQQCSRSQTSKYLQLGLRVDQDQQWTNQG